MSSTEKSTKTIWFGMKLTPEQKEKIRILARERGVSQKKAVMDLVEQATEDKPIKPKPGSFLEAARDLAGVGEGPGDASTNPKYMKDFGR
ncbi:MAG: hypothetical protein WD037_11315 [Balneolales bacterium]